MKLVPIGDRVIVRLRKPEEKVSGGIIIPEAHQETRQDAEVIAVGPGRWQDGKLVPLDVQPGDTVLIAKYGGDDIEVDGDKVRILTQDEIFAIVR